LPNTSKEMTHEYRSNEYLAELLSVMNDTKVSKELAIKLLKTHWIADRGGFENIESGCATNYISNVFGGFRCGVGRTGTLQLDKWVYDSSFRRYSRYKEGYEEEPWRRVHEKNGIEVLGAKPNATGSTYSRKCRITIKKLKEACKTNGIKITGLDKKGLLGALMKI